jgi:predicted nucleotidyltransferase
VTVAEAQLETYVAEVVETVRTAAPVAGAFVLGSALLGGFDPAASDVDLVVVVEPPLEAGPLVARLDGLETPFRKLELVVYARGAKPPADELNYPDGPGEPDFWFVLDAAIAQELAEGWLELLQPVSGEATRRAAEELLAWADERGEAVHAARARHYLEHGNWITKEEAQE